MTSNFFIGIGGSGAKSLEAFVHLCAAGLGPDKVWVGLVDQDAANGHVAQARQLVEAYIDLRAQLRPVGADCMALGNRLLHTQIVTGGDDLLWQPEPRQGATLGDHVFGPAALTDEQRQLLGCLFTPEELALPLDEGFRGRPAIGAATFLRAEAQASFWQELSDAVKRASHGGGAPGGTAGNNPVRVFLAGSICGGTGAAGFPTLARILNKDFGEHGVKIGGALLLPYFQFPRSTDPSEIVAESAGFLAQTSKALKYYYHLLKDDPIFSDLYVVGWNPLLSTTDKPEKGGDKQRNPPLAPELLAALAAGRFMRMPPGNNRIRYLGRRSAGALHWADLPTVTDLPNDHRGGAGQVRAAFGSLIRFAYAFNYVYAPRLIGGEWRNARDYPWFRTQVKPTVPDPGDGGVQATLVSLRRYCQRALSYFADMSHAMHRSQTAVELVQTSQYAGQPASGQKWAAPLTAEKTSHAEFARLIIDDQNNVDAGLGSILEKLSHRKPGSTSGRGIGVFCSALCDASALN